MNEGFEATELVFFDIETVPAQRPEIIAQLVRRALNDAKAEAAAVRAPSNYKDEAKIAEYVNAKRAEITEAAGEASAKALHATGLDGAFGELYCIGVAVNGDPPVVLQRSDMSPEAERALLAGFFSLIGDSTEPTYRKRMVGHNITGFDLRFISQRAVVLGVKLPRWWPRDPKPWSGEVADTMVAWAGARDRVSLSKLCQALDIPDEDTISGKDVWDCVQRGEGAKVAEHCRIDIDKTRKVYKRLAAAGAI